MSSQGIAPLIVYHWNLDIKGMGLQKYQKTGCRKIERDVSFILPLSTPCHLYMCVALLTIPPLLHTVSFLGYGCNKKVGLTGLQCKCGLVFCGLHRYPDEHDCTFDFKGHDRKKLAKELVGGGKFVKVNII